MAGSPVRAEASFCIEGQVRGLREMLQKDVYCVDILTQVSAVNAALNSFSKELLSEHLRTCVAENLREGNDGVVDLSSIVIPPGGIWALQIYHIPGWGICQEVF